MEFEILLLKLRDLLTKYTYCEDDKLRIKNGIKYDIYNLMNEYDRGFIKELHKELEYKDGEE